MVVAQLVEQLPLTQEIRGSNPNKILSTNCTFMQKRRKRKEEKEKEAGNGPSLKKYLELFFLIMTNDGKKSSMQCCESGRLKLKSTQWSSFFISA